ncbi:hypothetical protein [Massilia sp. 2TAF26]|uniref:hypothetical protein n=1 Tax=Massilia sp. 2TAF26 TaxID=3233012 RepID=UPI003F97DBF1
MANGKLFAHQNFSASALCEPLMEAAVRYQSAGLAALHSAHDLGITDAAKFIKYFEHAINHFSRLALHEADTVAQPLVFAYCGHDTVPHICGDLRNACFCGLAVNLREFDFRCCAVGAG